MTKTGLNQPFCEKVMQFLYFDPVEVEGFRVGPGVGSLRPSSGLIHLKLIRPNLPGSGHSAAAPDQPVNKSNLMLQQSRIQPCVFLGSFMPPFINKCDFCLQKLVIICQKLE